MFASSARHRSAPPLRAAQIFWTYPTILARALADRQAEPAGRDVVTMQDRLHIDVAELESLFQQVRSQLEISLRWFLTPAPTPTPIAP
jgi:hypothetical protein